MSPRHLLDLRWQRRHKLSYALWGIEYSLLPLVVRRPIPGVGSG